MNHRFLFSIVWVMMVVQLCAQEGNIPPLPPGPLLKRAPAYSTWTITFKGHPLGDKGPLKTDTTGEGNSKDKEPVTLVSNVIKTDSTILEQNVEADGQRRQIWHFSGFRLTSGISNSMISPEYGGGDIFSINFASSDFAGFDWLSKNTYSGIVKYEGRDCIVFKGTVSPLGVRDQIDERALIEQSKALGHSVPALKVPAAAWIDLETRLPLFAQFGEEKRIYLYGPPPQAPLQLPEQLAGLVKQFEEKIKKLSAPAVRAY